MRRVFNYSFLLPVLALFFYSFTQVDLSLTLSRASIFQTVEKSFQHIGYFNRPLSGVLFLLVIASLFLAYAYLLRRALKNKLQTKHLWAIIILTAGILAFSYNAFSYDFFNYIFDAKIITYYHLNPYLHKALDFPGDPMLSFMQWTHRTYPYGPIWLAITVPLSFIGHNIFLVTFFLFKFMSAGFYLGSSYLIWKTSERISPDYKTFNLVLFALNPLTIIELLVSAHNDGAMIFFALLALYLFFSGKKLFALIFAIISSQIKIPTAAIIPLIGSGFFSQLRIDTQKFVWLCVGVMTVALLYILTKIEMQPWYFLWILPFACLLKPNRYAISILLGFSLGLLLRYTPFIYSGDWNGLAPQVKGTVSLLVPLLFFLSNFLIDKTHLSSLFKIKSVK